MNRGEKPVYPNDDADETPPTAADLRWKFFRQDVDDWAVRGEWAVPRDSLSQIFNRYRRAIEAEARPELEPLRREALEIIAMVDDAPGSFGPEEHGIVHRLREALER